MYRICGGRSGTGPGFLGVLPFPPASSHSINCSILIITRDWYTTLTSGLSTKWILFQPTPSKKKGTDDQHSCRSEPWELSQLSVVLAGGKYAVLTSGDLYIHNAGPSDGYKSYACRTVHRLTGEVHSSTYPGRIIITGKTISSHRVEILITRYVLYLFSSHSTFYIYF
jgi:hypothetical protein